MARSSRLMLASLLGGMSLLAATPAHAQFFSPCLVFGNPLPPPCLVFDPTQFAQLATKLANEAKKLAQHSLIGENLATINKIFGSQQSSGNAIGTWAPINPGNEVSYAAAATTIQAAFPSTSASLTQAQSDAQIANIMIAKRAAAGDAYATAQALINSVEGLVTDGNTIAKTIGNCSLSARDDFQMNTLAKNLVLRANTALREARAAKTLSHALATASSNPIQYIPNPTMNDAPLLQAPNIPNFGGVLTQIAQATTQLQTLQNAIGAAQSFSNAQSLISGVQSIFDGLTGSSSQAQSALQALAQQTASKYGVSADALLNAAQSAMSQDSSAFDNPNKAQGEAQAASAALVALEGVVGGQELSSDWIQALINVDDTQKQLAFAKPLLGNLQANSAALLSAQSDFSNAIGIDITNPAQLNQAISSAQSQVNQLIASLADAPPNVQAQAHAMYDQIMAASTGGSVPIGNFTPTPTPTQNTSPLDGIRQQQRDVGLMIDNVP